MTHRRPFFRAANPENSPIFRGNPLKFRPWIPPQLTICQLGRASQGSGERQWSGVRGQGSGVSFLSRPAHRGLIPKGVCPRFNEHREKTMTLINLTPSPHPKVQEPVLSRPATGD